MTEVAHQGGLGAAQPEPPVMFLAVDSEGRTQRYTLPRSVALGMSLELRVLGAGIVWYAEEPLSRIL
jgi:hypothetical protein